MALRIPRSIATGAIVLTASWPAAQSQRPPGVDVLRATISTLREYRRGDFGESVTRLIDGQKISALARNFRRGAETWIDEAQPADRRVRIEVVGAVAVELMAASFSRDVFEYEESRELVEWACRKLREQPRPTSAERWFHLSSMALMQGAGDESLLSGRLGWDAMTSIPGNGSHVLHAGHRFPDEPRFKLGFLTTHQEIQHIATWPLPATYLIGDVGRFTIERPGDAKMLDQTLTLLHELFDDAGVGFEARLRSGILRFVRGTHTEAAIDLRVARESKDPWIVYLANLMLGAIAEQAGRLDEASTAYRIAHDAVPASTSSVALATLLFRSARPDEAAEILEAFARLPPQADPWRLYSQRDYRFFEGYRNQLRKAVQQ